MCSALIIISMDWMSVVKTLEKEAATVVAYFSCPDCAQLGQVLPTRKRLRSERVRVGLAAPQ